MKWVNNFYTKKYCFTSLSVNEISMHHESLVKKEKAIVINP
jgi:hypothetical protein